MRTSALKGATEGVFDGVAGAVVGKVLSKNETETTSSLVKNTAFHPDTLKDGLFFGSDASDFQQVLELILNKLTARECEVLGIDVLSSNTGFVFQRLKAQVQTSTSYELRRRQAEAFSFEAVDLMVHNAAEGLYDREFSQYSGRATLYTTLARFISRMVSSVCQQPSLEERIALLKKVSGILQQLYDQRIEKKFPKAFQLFLHDAIQRIKEGCYRFQTEVEQVNLPQKIDEVRLPIQHITDKFLLFFLKQLYGNSVIPRDTLNTLQNFRQYCKMTILSPNARPFITVKRRADINKTLQKIVYQHDSAINLSELNLEALETLKNALLKNEALSPSDRGLFRDFYPLFLHQYQYTLDQLIRELVTLLSQNNQKRMHNEEAPLKILYMRETFKLTNLKYLKISEFTP